MKTFVNQGLSDAQASNFYSNQFDNSKTVNNNHEKIQRNENTIFESENCFHSDIGDFTQMQPMEKVSKMHPGMHSTISMTLGGVFGQSNPTNRTGFTFFKNSEIIQREESSESAPRTDTRYGLGIRNRFGLYDAILNRDIKTLTLQMRIAFNFTGSWPSDASKTQWFRAFKRLVEKRWSYRFYLIPDGTCRYSEDQRTYFARLNVEQVTSNPHFNVDVVHTTTNLPSSANSVSRTATLDSMDIEERTREQDGNQFQQRGVEHEFGHMLGVSHVECDVVTGVCPAGDQYGDTAEEATDIMGIGWVVTERNYYPFTTAMYYFTGCNWRASHQMYNP